MFVEIAAASFLVGQFIYHRWIEDKPTKRTPGREIQIPRVDVGAPVPIIYGRCRVRAPILVWHSTPRYSAPSYDMNMLYVLGVPFASGNATSRLYGMWAGDWKLSFTDSPPEMTGDGGPEGQGIVIGTGANGEDLGTGLIEFLNGNPAQELAEDGTTSSTARTMAGRHMLSVVLGGGNLTLDDIPGYRGYLSVFMYGSNTGLQWRFGASPTIPSYSFEAASYDTENPYLSTYARIGSIESNPINALYDLLTSKFGGLGLSSDLIDIPSFQAAAYTLYTEWHGYSRCIEDAADAEEHIMEILRQIDGALRHNTRTNKIEIKLIRNDYDPTTIPHITKHNGAEIVSFAASGWSGLPNKVQVIWTDRANDYQENSSTDENQVSASLDASNPLVLQYPGVCYETLAQVIAKRELAARNRPLIKMRVYVGREFLRVAQGDAVKVTWSNPDIAGLIFRVANVEHGTLEDGRIALDLIQDYYYVHRNATPEPPTDTLPIPPIDVLG